MALNIFEEIDITPEADTFYEAVEKSMNNWATMDTELNNARGGEATLDTRLDGIDTTVSTHIADTTTHGTTGDIVGTTDTQTLSGKTLTSPVLNTGLSGTAFLDEDNMASDSATKACSQQSIKAYIDTGTVTMSNKTLTSPVINTGVSGTAFLDEDAMGSNSATKFCSQQSIKAYVDSQEHVITEYTGAGTPYSYVGGNGASGGAATRNTVLGYQAGQGLSAGVENAMFGSVSGSGTDVSYCTCIGHAAGNVVTGDANSFFGNSSGLSCAAGVANTAAGLLSQAYNVTGDYNASVGAYALQGASGNSHDYNTCLGGKSGQNVTTGSNNTTVGYQTGDNITSGASNIIIGYNIDPASATADNQFMLGNATYPFLKGEMNNYILAINGANGYLNFNTTLGTNGYGIRDNAGVMEFKDSGGSWITFASLVN
jgi:hypothetical protein